MEKTQILLDLIKIKNKLEELKQNTRLMINEIENIETEIDKTIAKKTLIMLTNQHLTTLHSQMKSL